MLMTSPAVNEEFLTGNTCFGCGPTNPDGLRIRIYRDGPHTDRLVGHYQPRATQGGFPQIVHGGLQFTALDCMAAWVVFVLRAPPRMIPLTRSASMRFHKAVKIPEALALSAVVTREAAGPRDPISIRAEIRDPKGELLSDADFEYITLPDEKFCKLVDVAQLPDSYRRHFGQS
jgi:acyl-coenzyme A thioesterase PaaI-like protein